MDLGDLSDDKQIIEKLNNLHNSVKKIQDILNLACNNNKATEKLNAIDKVNYDLFLSYNLVTLFWMYLRTKGIDPNQNIITNELKRVREYMVKAKQAHDRMTIRPKLNKDVSRRFIKHILSAKETAQPPNKKIKFN